MTHGASAKGVVEVAGLGVDVTGVAVGEAWDADGVAFTSLGGRPGCFLQPAASVHVQVSSLVSCVDRDVDCHISLKVTISCRGVSYTADKTVPGPVVGGPASTQ
jgi:hypothetical protein